MAHAQCVCFNEFSTKDTEEFLTDSHVATDVKWER